MKLRPIHLAVAATVAVGIPVSLASFASSQADGEECEFVGLLDERLDAPDNPFAPPQVLPDTFTLTVVAECEFVSTRSNSDGTSSTTERKEMRFTPLDVEALTMIVDTLDGRMLPDLVEVTPDDVTSP